MQRNKQTPVLSGSGADIGIGFFSAAAKPKQQIPAVETTIDDQTYPTRAQGNKLDPNRPPADAAEITLRF